MTDARKEPKNGKYGSDSKQIHSHPSEKTKEQLLDELIDYLSETDEYTYDEAKHDAILAELAQLDPAPEITDTEDSLAAFHKKYASLFTPDDAAHSAEEISIISPKKRSRRKIFKVLPIAAALTLVLAIGAQAFGVADILGLFKRVTSEWLHVGSEDIPNATITLMPLAEGETAEYDTLQDALDAFGIKEELVPQYIPERFTLETVQAMHQPTNVLIRADYVSDDGYLLIQYRETTPDDHSFEMEGPHTRLYDCAGLSHRIMLNYEQSSVYWQNGELICSINGPVSEDEMIKIIESIYEGENSK